MNLEPVPVTFQTACDFVGQEHSTHGPPPGWKYGLGVGAGTDLRLVGVLMAGRPVSRHQDDGETIEFVRVCTDGTENVASKLRGHGIRVAWNLGYRRVIEYTLEEQEGSSLKAVGFREVRKSPGGSWDRETRPRVDRHPVGQKRLWEVVA